MNKIIVVVLVIGVCATSLGVFYDRLEQQFLPKTTDILVLNLPKNYQPKTVFRSYDGPHPAIHDRPVETFPFPISYGETGPATPLFAGNNDYPFLCATERSGLGQPLIDNQDKAGIAIYSLNQKQQKTKHMIGYSKDCLLPTKVQYYAKIEKESGFQLVEKMDELSDPVEEYVRVETGTINRFIYVLAIPVTHSDRPTKFDPSKWNSRLLYRFKGGVGVGRKQGSISVPKLLYEHGPQLAQGYAVAFSTGTQTSNHYDIWLSEDTALRVKKQFAARYGEPLYTIGIGGSGGAIQQYLLSQNHPGILDGAIPLYSYPDMVTQVNYALDCELTEYYFDVTSGDENWDNWANRTLIQGSNAIHGYKNRYGRLQGIAGYMNGDFSLMPEGASECTNGWRGPAQHINNPYFFSSYYMISEATRKQVDWSHWGNLRHIYGTNEDGFGRRFWDNQGVQYGLTALKTGELSIRDFLSLNKYIGGWKAPQDMENEQFWHISGAESMRDLSLWSQHNMTHEGDRRQANRTTGDKAAISAAYKAGLVYLGMSDLPIIDLRHYLDHKLDMHHAVASFTARKRIQAAMGHSDHQLIWMAEKDDNLSRKDLLQSLPIDDALLVLDQWLINIKANPDKTVAENKPASANDRCYDSQKNIIDDQNGTWDGQWNGKPVGVCQTQFPHYSQSRMVAGDSIYNDTLSCNRISISKALSSGVYGKVNMKPYKTELEGIFPEGVCQYEHKPHDEVMALIHHLKQNLAPTQARVKGKKTSG
jgi:hypothetical protein